MSASEPSANSVAAKMSHQVLGDSSMMRFEMMGIVCNSVFDFGVSDPRKLCYNRYQTFGLSVFEYFLDTTTYLSVMPRREEFGQSACIGPRTSGILSQSQLTK